MCGKGQIITEQICGVARFSAIASKIGQIKKKAIFYTKSQIITEDENVPLLF